LVDQHVSPTHPLDPGRSSPPPPDVAAALTAAARLLHQPTGRDETLVAVARAARDTVPGVDGAGISVVTAGRLEQAVVTDDLARRLAEAQHELAQGPCIDALDGQGVVVAEHLQGERRWPQYLARARALGLRSQVALQLHDEETVLGVLNLYSTSEDDVRRETVRVAELFAVHAGTALLGARHRQQMNDALASRKVIGQAIGLVMERYRLDDQRAFEFLVRISQSTNVKIRDVAAELVEQAVSRTSPQQQVEPGPA